MSPEGWRTSRHCIDTACAEIASWRTARACDGGTCVEAGAGPGVIGVRDTTDRDGTRLEFPASAWIAFMNRMK